MNSEYDYWLLVISSPVTGKILMDMEFKDKMTAVREEYSLRDLGFVVERFELSTALLFNTIPDEVLDADEQTARFLFN